jgi:DNA repair protein RadC
MAVIADRSSDGPAVFGLPEAAVADRDLLAALVGFGLSRSRARRLADHLLERGRGLAGVAAMDAPALLAVPGLGPARYRLLHLALELARRAAGEALLGRDLLGSPAATRRFLQLHLGASEREVFCCLFLDSQHRLLCAEDVFFGTLDGAAVYPREIVVRALRYRAAAVIFAHNHPSGAVGPSAADRQITVRLRDALALVDVRVLDHLVVGAGAFYSFAEHGLL